MAVLIPKRYNICSQITDSIEKTPLPSGVFSALLIAIFLYITALAP